jgi:hypothetical protein
MFRRKVLFQVFGLGMVALALAPTRSRAADTATEPEEVAVHDARATDLQLLPLLARHDAPLFGSFVRPGGRRPPLPTDEACPTDMVEVEGDYCPYVEQKCLRYLDPATKLQCAEFEKLPTAGRCASRTDHKHFCIDRYEWPNKAGTVPTIMASWEEAKTSCEAIGKRLCSDTEWTLSCEGPDRTPYPYGDGYARDASACNIDKPYIFPDAPKVYNPRTQAEELARLDQREPSGARESCTSPYGVHDMVGNVDEWVVNASQGGWPYVSALKGGYWGPVRTKCRGITTGHGPTFKYYQIGFRCCGDAQRPETRELPLVSL